MAKNNARTAEIFEQFAQHEEYLGYGYIGERRYLTDRQREVSDRNALAAAENMTDEELFEWANNKVGRWYADCATFRSSGICSHSEKFLPGTKH